MKTLTVGIDLGTVNTCVATFDGSKVKILEIHNERIIPSSVCFSDTSADVYVGKAAEAKNQKNVLIDAKRFIGRRFEDPHIQKIYKNYAFKISGDTDNKIYFNIKYNNKDEKIRPEAVSTEILKHIKSQLLIDLDADCIEAIITVPAHFNNNQREQTKLAAAAAGIKVLKLINEPTAAATQYFSKGVKDTVKAMVFDLGGGTFDISIINIVGRKIEVQATDGDSFLGGRNFDENITNYFVEKLRERFNCLTDQQKARLKTASKKLKEDLSYREEAEYIIDNFSENGDEILKLDRASLNDLNRNLFEKCLNIMKNCLTSKHIKTEEIDEIILVGGSSKIPKLQDMLKEYFENKKLKLDIDADEAVAGGAALLAYLQNNSSVISQELRDLYIEDVNPLSLGVKTIYDNMSTIIPRNSPLPVTATENFCTIYNNQTDIELPIYEGERKHVIYNNLLGKLGLSNLPPKPARQVNVDVTFQINEEGILNVTACYEKNLVKTELNIYNLSNDEVKTKILEAYKEEEYDENFAKFVTAKIELLDICNKNVVFDSTRIIAKLESTDMENWQKITDEIDMVNEDEMKKKLQESWTKYLGMKSK